jgi:hypothetical protein
MSLISQSPLDYGIFYGSGAGAFSAISSGVAYTLPVPLSTSNRPTEFAQKNGNNIEILKNGKYQIFFKFNFSYIMNFGSSGARYATIRFEKNSTILKKMNYYMFNGIWQEQVNEFNQELNFVNNDTGFFNTTATGQILTFVTPTNFQCNSIFSTNVFSELQTGDIISLTFLTTNSSNVNSWVVNPEIIIKEVKY